METREIDQNTYADFFKNTEQRDFFILPEYVRFYEDHLLLGTYKGDHLVAIWAVPRFEKDQKRYIKREYRFLPYSKIVTDVSDNKNKYDVASSMFNYLKGISDIISLPLDPSFQSFVAFQFSGGFIEMRHTHVIDCSADFGSLDPKLRNHIRFAQKNFKISVSDGVHDFGFGKAIKGNDEEQTRRASLGEKLIEDKRAFVVTSTNDGVPNAQIHICYSDGIAYGMHSWTGKSDSRGALAACMWEGIQYLNEKDIAKKFDLEGSVISGVDRFFRSFNGDVVAYPYLHWAKKEDDLVALLLTSKNIQGRSDPL